jgi:hypothetical protein
MRDRWSVIVGAILFAAGAIGMAVWLWFKRRQLLLAAAKAAPEEAIAAPTEQTSALTDEMPEQASAVTNAIQDRQPSGR